MLGPVKVTGQALVLVSTEGLRLLGGFISACTSIKTTAARAKVVVGAAHTTALTATHTTLIHTVFVTVSHMATPSLKRTEKCHPTVYP